MRWLIICTCGHTFTRATICRKDLRTWACPRRRGVQDALGHQTRAGNAWERRHIKEKS